MRYDYLIVGGGLAAESAVEGIRAHDPSGTIALLSRENFPPYHRPPLSKGLWFGKSTLDDLQVHPDPFYAEHGVTMLMRREAVELDPDLRRLWDDGGTVHEYGKLLLATGGVPRRLAVAGAELEGILYFLNPEDYLVLRRSIDRVRHALVVGGGFIGMEMSAALRHAGVDVTLLYPEEYPLRKVLPRDLGHPLSRLSERKDVHDSRCYSLIGAIAHRS